MCDHQYGSSASLLLLGRPTITLLTAPRPLLWLFLIMRCVFTRGILRLGLGLGYRLGFGFRRNPLEYLLARQESSVEGVVEPNPFKTKAIKSEETPFRQD